MIRPVRHGRRLRRFLDEIDDPLGIVDMHDAETLGLFQRHLDAADGEVSLPLGVIGQHETVIHLVDVVACQDDDIFGIALAQDVEVLVDGIGRAGIPAFLHALLGRHDIDELAQLAAQETPALLDMADQRVGLVLRQHANLPDTGIETVRQGKIDDAELASERHGRLGAPLGQGMQATAPPAGQDQRQRLPRQTTDESGFVQGFWHGGRS